MSLLGRRALVWVLLALVVMAGAAALFSDRIPLQTDLLALLPPTERNPLAEKAIAKLAEAGGGRTVFLIGTPRLEETGRAARFFVERLRESGAFRRLSAEMPPFDLRAAAGSYLEYRFNLLAEPDREALDAGRFDLEKRLRRKLYAPFGFGAPLSVEDDPFGALDAWLAALPFRSFKLEPEGGLLVARDRGRVWGLAVGELSGRAYDNALQLRLAEALRQAEHAVRERFPGVEILRAGTVFYADAARATAESEMDFIGSVSTVCIVLLLTLVFRSFAPLALGLLSVGFGVLAATVVSVFVFGELHLVTLVFGASLIGDAIDYPIQYFSARLGAGAAWDADSGLRRIAPGLTTALAVGLLGYGALMFLPFPALAQISVFSMTGLLATWLTVLLLLPFLTTSPDARGAQSIVEGFQRALDRLFSIGKKKCLGITVALLAVALPGCFAVRWNDDVHLLVSRSPALAEQEARIRTLAGYSGGSQFFLVEGKTEEETLRNEEALSARLTELAKEGVIAGHQGVSSFVPSRARQARNRGLWKEKVFADRENFRRILSDAGLYAIAADRLIEAFDASEGKFLGVEAWLESPLSLPARDLWLGKTPEGFASIVALRDIRDIRRLEAFAADAKELEGVVFVDKAGSVSRLFRLYRETGCVWLLCAVGLIALLLCARYGLSQSLYLLAPALVSMALSASAFGYLGIPLSLFNVLGLMLVLCVGVNYAIFLREGGIKTAATLVGVLLSALTDLLAFGLLAFSSTPMLSGFGLTLLVGIGAAIVLTSSVPLFCKESIP
jgi:predicted exporter